MKWKAACLIAQSDVSAVEHDVTTLCGWNGTMCQNIHTSFVKLGQLVEKLTLEDANTADDLRRLFLSVFPKERGLKSNIMYHTLELISWSLVPLTATRIHPMSVTTI
jgi:hypothetical protein